MGCAGMIVEGVIITYDSIFPITIIYFFNFSNTMKERPDLWMDDVDCLDFVCRNLGIKEKSQDVALDKLMDIVSLTAHNGSNVEVIIYYEEYEGKITGTHFGFVLGDRVISKWGRESANEHTIEEAQEGYGQTVQYYAIPKKYQSQLGKLFNP